MSQTTPEPAGQPTPVEVEQPDPETVAPEAGEVDEQGSDGGGDTA